MAAIEVCRGEVGGRPAVWVLGMERERERGLEEEEETESIGGFGVIESENGGMRESESNSLMVLRFICYVKVP